MVQVIDCDWCGESFEEYQSRIEEYENNFCSRDCSNEHKRKDQLVTNCSWCGDTVRVPECHQDSMGDAEINNHFCDKDCESDFKSEHLTGEDNPNWDGGKETVVCEECDDEYKVKPSVVSESKFCSVDCFNENQTTDDVTKQCVQCGTNVTRKPYEFKTENATCSDECLSQYLSEIRRGEENPAWVGGKAIHYGSNWNMERRKALEEAEYECKLCSMTRDEHYETYGIDLDVHHRIPLRSFDEPERANFQDNLVVACRECHFTVLEADPVPHNDFRAPA